MTEQTKVEQAEAWTALALRVAAFILGAAILWSQAHADVERIWLQIIGAGLCGPVVAQSVATIVSAARGGDSP